MKSVHSKILVAMTCALITVTANAQTADSVKTRIGTLNFEQGYPTAETAQKLYDEMDFQRAVQAFLWSFPAVSFESIRIGNKRATRDENRQHVLHSARSRSGEACIG